MTGACRLLFPIILPWRSTSGYLSPSQHTCLLSPVSFPLGAPIPNNHPHSTAGAICVRVLLWQLPLITWVDCLCKTFMWPLTSDEVLLTNVRQSYQCQSPGIVYFFSNDFFPPFECKGFCVEIKKYCMFVNLLKPIIIVSAHVICASSNEKRLVPLPI